MIISRTPYRVSFIGGGTDLPAYYGDNDGMVISAAIKHYMYVTIHQRFESNWRISYSSTEIADNIDDIQHDIVREALLMAKIEHPLEITTIGDVPAGTGLGSSSSLAVGLLTALYTHSGIDYTREQLAQEASAIEINILKRPIGKQDQYAAAYGGLNRFYFNSTGTVDRHNLTTEVPNISQELETHCLLFYTGVSRDANIILQRQVDQIGLKSKTLDQIFDLAIGANNALKLHNLEAFGQLIDHSWRLKRTLDSAISNPMIDDWYDTAKQHGAYGGKLLGAGGGGFLLIVAPGNTHQAIRTALGNPHELAFNIENSGSYPILVKNHGS